MYNKKQLKVENASNNKKKNPNMKGTHMNIQSSVNDMFMRNQMMFGPSGKRRYLPMEEGGEIGWLDEYGDGSGWLDEYQPGGQNYGDDYSKSRANMNMLELSQNTPAPKKAFKFNPKALPHAPANMQEAQQLVDAQEKHQAEITAAERLAYSRMTKAQKEKYDAAKEKERYVNNPGFMDYASQLGHIPLLAMSNPFNMGEKLKELRAIKVNDNLSPWQKFDQMGNVGTEATTNALLNAATEGIAEGLLPGVVNKVQDLTAKSLTKVNKANIKKLADAPVFPGFRQPNLPETLSHHVMPIGDSYVISLKDPKGNKYGHLALSPEKKYIKGTQGEYITEKPVWAKPDMISVAPRLQGNKTQDLLYQLGIEEANKRGMKGVRSGDVLLSPAKTKKAHERFNREILGSSKYWDDVNKSVFDVDISGLTGHTNPSVIEDWYKNYALIDKLGKRNMYSLNDVGSALKKGYKQIAPGVKKVGSLAGVAAGIIGGMEYGPEMFDAMKSMYDSDSSNFVPNSSPQTYQDGLNMVKAKGLNTTKSKKTLAQQKNGGPVNWLDQYDDGGSIVNYLSSKGQDYSKKGREALAKKMGIKDYDFSAEKNTELLERLKQTEKIKPMKEQFLPEVTIQANQQDLNTAWKQGQGKTVVEPYKQKNAQSIAEGNNKAVGNYLNQVKKYTNLGHSVKDAQALVKLESKEDDMLKEYTPQGGFTKALEVAANPFTAFREKTRHGSVPDYLNKNTDNEFYSPTSVADMLWQSTVGSPIAIASSVFNVAPALSEGDYVGAGLNALDALPAIPNVGHYVNEVPKKIGRSSRDKKFANELVIGDKTFKNSKDWLDAYNTETKIAGSNRPLSTEEIDFLNKEIQDRGILETQRRHPLRPATAKRWLQPEDYNFKRVGLDFIPNLIKGNVTSKYAWGPGRENAFNQYLGLPTENSMYRVHPESFQNGQGLVYTVPQEQLNLLQNKTVVEDARRALEAKNSKKPRKQFESGYVKMHSPKLEEDLSDRFLLPALHKESLKDMTEAERKLFNEKAYDILRKEGFNPSKTGRTGIGPKKDFDYNKRFKNQANMEDIPWSSFKRDGVHYLNDVDDFSNAGGNMYWEATDLPEGKEKWRMKDTWDINPLDKLTKLPKFIRDMNAGKLIGGKDFPVWMDYMRDAASGDITPLIPKKQGGSVNWLDDYL